MAILVISMMDEGVFAARCLKAGANAFIMREEAPNELIRAMTEVLKGGIYLSVAAARGLIARAGHDVGSPVGRPTDRELQIFHMIGSGLKPGDIARRLSLSPRTVHPHKQNIREKLGLHDVAELTVRAAAWVGTTTP